MIKIDRSAVAIAEVVSDLQAGRIGYRYKDPKVFDDLLGRAQRPGPVVDATQLYQSLVANPKPVYIYEDHPNIAPPWSSALITYVNEHRNVVVLQVSGFEFPQGRRKKLWDTDEPVDWNAVRWVVQVAVWVGGWSDTLSEGVPVAGPLHMWRHAVSDSGEPLEIRWVSLEEKFPLDYWDMAHLVILGTLNFMNCRNVDLVEPVRPRAERRRIARTGVQVSVINVFPVGKSTRSNGGEAKNPGVPLTSVRGHFSHYGPDYGKGLLFGKLAGRFWIPQHARGDKTLGETTHDYVLKPGG